MKLNQNKKTELLNLSSCSKDLLIWIQLQALQEDIIEITYKHYTEDVKVSLNTFKKALGGLLDSKILFATSKKGKFKLNKDFITDSYFYNNGLGDFKQHRILTEEESELFIQQWIKENNKPFTFCSLDKENTFTVKNYPNK